MNKKYILPAAAATLLMASCADEFNPEYSVERPVDLAKLAELADYQPLKEYINRDAHPGFKLGAALAADDFNKKLGVYNVAVTNFDEIVAGNAMKHASCIDDAGNDKGFSTVNTFVNNATEAGLTVYGHTLAWHAQQNTKYLYSLIADRELPPDPNAGVELVEVKSFDYTSMGSFPFYVMGYTPDMDPENGLCSVFQGDWYQYFIADGIGTKEGATYIIECEIRGEADGSCPFNFQWGWGGGESVSGRMKFTSEWSKQQARVEGCGGSNSFIVFQPGTDPTTFYVRNLTVYEEKVKQAGAVQMEKYWENIIDNGDMEGSDAKNFAKKENSGAIVYEITDGVGKDGSRGVAILSKGGQETAWESQFWIVSNIDLQEGEKIHVAFDYRAKVGGNAIDTQAHYGPGEYQHWSCVGSPTFTTEWQRWDKTATVDASMAGANGMKSIAFNMSPNSADDEYYIDNVVFEVERERPAKVVVNYVENSDMEGDDAHNFVRKENNGAFETVITPGVGVGGSCGVQVTSKAGAAEDWDTQFWIVMNDGMWLQEGDQVTVSFDYKASANASADTQAHAGPGAYQHWACIGSPNFTTEWQTYTKALTVDASMAGASGLGSIAFNLSKDRGQDVTYYFDNIRVYAEKDPEIPANTIPLTPEEKHDTCVYAMEQWIAGMMEACEGKVKAWDVVNEAIAGEGNEEGYYTLQSEELLRKSLIAQGKTEADIEKEVKNSFFWQDNMGNDEYVRQAVRLARKYYAESLAENGGDDGQLKLFVNDYNLESDWDKNQKVKSLVYWINRWESDGVTKIDGIGSQMHISYYEDAQTLESKKAAIVEMLKIMSGTGKLVRISELDMGYVKADGSNAGLNDMTNEMEQKMEQYYQWIIEQYLTIVPPAQQYGITQWCLTDAPAGVGWRGDEPVGIWDTNWNRKYVYRGWVNGLQK